MSDFKYVGSELELFAGVHNWKSYWSSQILPFISGDVLEVGAGIGSNTPYLIRGEHRRWVCLEPDRALSAQSKINLAQTLPDHQCEVACGTVQDLKGSQFDTVIYIDVLEHIENDRRELELAGNLVRQGGRVIVLAPAHQRLFTPFDAAIGHYRRYNHSQLRDITPATLRIEKLWYLDSASLLLSTTRRYLFRQSMPSKDQLAFWDRYVIPASRVLDRCLFGAMGKSIVGAWTRA